jgi:TonB family protein
LNFLNSLVGTQRSIFGLAIALSLVLHFFLLFFSPAKSTISKQASDTLVVVKLEEPPKFLQPLLAQTNQTPTTKALASQHAPSAPTTEEWAFASKYTLKNSKGYRHSWGKQVRSMMGTAFEGADQGQVRFRIEIAPNGSLVRVETLWKTSDKAEQLARKAMKSMPPLPPTPTGKSLTFEKTISFSPFANDDSPIYSNDCLPDLPVFNNPFAWDGKSPQEIKKSTPAEQLTPEALAECLKQLPQDSIEGVTAHDQRQLDQWGSSKLNAPK